MIRRALAAVALLATLALGAALWAGQGAAVWLSGALAFCL